MDSEVDGVDMKAEEKEQSEAIKEARKKKETTARGVV